LLLFQVLLILIGSLWVVYSFYCYYRRPSVVVIPIVVTISLLAMIIAVIVPVIWLTTSGKISSAKVTGMDCQPGKKHHVYYQFLMDGKLVNDVGPDGYGNPMCASLKVGDMGLVTYITSEPNIHVWGKASEYLIERLVAGLFVLGTSE